MRTAYQAPTDAEAAAAGRRESVLRWVADSRGWDASHGVLFWRSPEGWCLSVVDGFVVTSAEGATRDDAIRDLYRRTVEARQARHHVEDRSGDRAQLAALGEQLGLVGR